MIKKIIFSTLLTFLCFELYCSAEEQSINVLSNELKINKELRTSHFSGEVYAYDQNLEIWSDELIITLEETENKIKDVLAKGNVKIIRMNTVVYGNKAQYFLKDNSIIVTKNVVVIENGNKIQGEELVLDLETSLSIMKSGNSNRVEATIIKE